MIPRIPAALGACLLAAACASPNPGQPLALSSAAAQAPAVAPGIHPDRFDAAVPAKDDLYRHVNGAYIARTPIPPDKSWYGTFIELRDRSLDQLHDIVDGLERDPASARDPDARKIRDLYASFMDEARVDALGLKPIAGELARIDALRSKDQVPALIAHFNEIGVGAPYSADVHQDARDSTRYIVDLVQGGLGLPDRDYYLKDDDARLRQMRAKYEAHIEKMLRMSGERHAPRVARGILALETRLARVQWTRVENRDPVKRYNPVPVARLPKVAPGVDWKRYLVAAEVEGKIDTVVVSQPSYLQGFAKVLRATPLETWKQYFRWRLLSAYAPYLSKPYVDERFEFVGHVLQGIPENRPRWKRGIELVEGSIGFALGKVYVARYFPPERKARMDQLVRNLLEAYRQSLEGLDWMGPQTKKEALAKLAAFTPKIGYPAEWRDYSKLEIDRGDLVGNVMRANRFEYRRDIAKLGKPVDRAEWFMTPQTVNAYYNPEINEVVFPAAILQPPFFDASADDAVNYGAIGAVIGHEISHGFDDWGSQYDGQGNLRNWWTKQDHERYAARTAKLVAQYGAYSPLPGYHLNGKLTLGENIADNAGLEMAWKAYQISLHGKPAPAVGGLTGAQRFFISWAQVWAEEMRPEEQVRRIKVDPHSPGRFRCDGAASNQAAFYDAFGVKPGDGMYLPPERRVSIW
ncbi:MAG TPA: M13 family metallopeptidase [Usitatibacter sp.]|nr:M13 family metallopeptidase [Usitatibacter sp.]